MLRNLSRKLAPYVDALSYNQILNKYIDDRVDGPGSWKHSDIETTQLC